MQIPCKPIDRYRQGSYPYSNRWWWLGETGVSLEHEEKWDIANNFLILV